MSDTYTPTTEEVRDAYADRKDFESQVRTGLHASEVESLAEFHRWLTAHAAQVRAEVLREAADRIEQEARADECTLHDVASVSDLPELSRVMLNGVTRSAERLRAMAASPVHDEGEKR